jgi:hypothetical protein
LLGSKLARLLIDHAQRAEVVAVLRPEGTDCIEAQPEFSRDEGIRKRAWIDLRVSDDPDLVCEYGRRAEPGVTVDLLDALEPRTDLNQIRSWSTRLTIAIGISSIRLARRVMRSNDPSGGVSSTP